MSKYHPYPNESDMNVRVMVGDPIAIAWLWIVAYVENLNERITSSYDMDEYNHQLLTIDELIDTAMTHLDSKKDWPDYIIRGGAFEGIPLDPTFWDKLSILREIEIASSNRNNIFSCAC